MKKTLLLLLLGVPVVAGAVYLRSLASWRPQKVFGRQGKICHLVFSNDGKTLLVTQSNSSSGFGTLTKITALNATDSFVPEWIYQDGSEVVRPQFYLSDSRVLVAGASIRTLNAKTGTRLSKQNGRSQAAAAPDGKWLAHNNLSIIDWDAIVKLAESPKDIFLDKFPRTSTSHRDKQDRIIREESRSGSTYFFSPDGKTFVVNAIVRDGDGMRSRLDFYDVNTWKRTRFWWSGTVEHTLIPGNTHLSHNGRFLLCISYSYSSKPQSNNVTVSLWRLSDGQKLSSRIFRGTVIPSAFGPFISMPFFEVQNDGRVLKFGTDGDVSLSKNTNLNDSFEPLLSLPTETITTAALSLDGSYLVAGTQSGRIFWQRVK